MNQLILQKKIPESDLKAVGITCSGPGVLESERFTLGLGSVLASSWGG